MSSTRQKRMKAASQGRGELDRSVLTDLEQLPNVGPAVAAYIRRAGVVRPSDLVRRDPYAMFDEACRVTGRRLDLCLLDTFIAVVRFMGGEPAKQWWKYTPERKRELERRRANQGAG